MHNNIYNIHIGKSVSMFKQRLLKFLQPCSEVSKIFIVIGFVFRVIVDDNLKLKDKFR
jgi:hypothetical protein